VVAPAEPLALGLPERTKPPDVRQGSPSGREWRAPSVAERKGGFGPADADAVGVEPEWAAVVAAVAALTRRVGVEVEAPWAPPAVAVGPPLRAVVFLLVAEVAGVAPLTAPALQGSVVRERQAPALVEQMRLPQEQSRGPRPLLGWPHRHASPDAATRGSRPVPPGVLSLLCRQPAASGAMKPVPSG